MFKFKGDLLLSKSWLNRALVIQSYGQGPQVSFDSTSEDVQVLKAALASVDQASEFYLGQGGTSFRFFCFFISRRKGDWKIAAHPRLLDRPQGDLKKILDQLGVRIEFQKDHLRIISEGWQIPEVLSCEAKDSSQFISALLLNSWRLDRDLKIQINGPVVSEDYLKMTMKMLRACGMNLIENDFLQIEKNQTPNLASLMPEVDVSSAFSIVGAAVISGDLEITNWNSRSSQPDLTFLKIFNQMKIKFTETDSTLKISKNADWQGVSVNLNRCPDLFPVLAVLCAFANGKSDLYGAEQLVHKESNRLLKTKELLDLTGFRSELKADGLVIHGKSSNQDKGKNRVFNPDHDHRMAMAAALFKLAGYAIEIADASVVNKSFPTFWRDVGLSS